MADMKMCANVDCTKKFNCARFMAMPELREQKYDTQEHENCKIFWHLRQTYFRLRKASVALAHHTRLYKQQKDASNERFTKRYGNDQNKRIVATIN